MIVIAIYSLVLHEKSRIVIVVINNESGSFFVSKLPQNAANNLIRIIRHEFKFKSKSFRTRSTYNTAFIVHVRETGRRIRIYLHELKK